MADEWQKTKQNKYLLGGLRSMSCEINDVFKFFTNFDIVKKTGPSP